MNILLDSQPIELPMPVDRATVGQALDAARGKLSGTNLMIFGVRCDGVDVSPEHLDQVLASPAQGFTQLEFITGHPFDVVSVALKQARMALADTFVTVKDASEALAHGRIPEAMSALVRCLNVWGQTHEAIIQGGSLCGLDFEHVVIHDRPLLDWLHDLARQLRGLKGAIESRDHVLLGDILQYELDETLCDWEAMLTGIVEYIERQNPAAQQPVERTITP